MSIIELPVWRRQGHASAREALRSGVAVSLPYVRLVKAGDHVSVHGVFCDRCASPIEFGAVTNGQGRYCSVECSFGGPVRPA